MMISVGIFVAISGMVLANYNGFNSKVLLSNLAYDLALTIRQAQTFGISVRQSAGGSFANAYGVYIEEDAGDGSTVAFYFFYDDGDYVYESSGPGACDGECLKKYALTRGNKISAFCINIGATCSSGTSLKSLTFMFKRPNPDTLFRAVRDNNTVINPDPLNTSLSTAITDATITVQSPKGDTKTITIRPTGQVSVN
jgi:hypothetical protein